MKKLIFLILFTRLTAFSQMPVLVKTFINTPRTEQAQEFTAFKGKTFFWKFENDNWNIYSTDGTPSGTTKTIDISLNCGGIGGPGFVGPRRMITLNGILLFFSQYSNGDFGLFKTDGTQGVTSRLRLFPKNSAQPTGGYDETIVFNNEVYFSGYDVVAGLTLFKTDGTISGTVMVRNVAFPRNFYLALNKLFFTTSSPLGKLTLL